MAAITRSSSMGLPIALLTYSAPAAISASMCRRRRSKSSALMAPFPGYGRDSHCPSNGTPCRCRPHHNRGHRERRLAPRAAMAPPQASPIAGGRWLVGAHAPHGGIDGFGPGADDLDPLVVAELLPERGLRQVRLPMHQACGHLEQWSILRPD